MVVAQRFDISPAYGLSGPHGVAARAETAARCAARPYSCRTFPRTPAPLRLLPSCCQHVFELQIENKYLRMAVTSVYVCSPMVFGYYLMLSTTALSRNAPQEQELRVHALLLPHRAFAACHAPACHAPVYDGPVYAGAITHVCSGSFLSNERGAKTSSLMASSNKRERTRRASRASLASVHDG